MSRCRHDSLISLFSKKIFGGAPARGFAADLLSKAADLGIQEIDTPLQFIGGEQRNVAADLMLHRFFRAFVVEETHMAAPG